MRLSCTHRVWSFDVDQLDTDVLPAENGKERRFRSTAFPLLFGSLKTVWRFQQRPRDGFTLAIRRAASSRLAESA